MSRANTVISEDGFEMDSMTYCRKSRTRLQAAQDLFAVAEVLNDAMEEYEKLVIRRNEILQNLKDLKANIRDKMFVMQNRINTELENIEVEYSSDMEELAELTKIRTKCKITGEQFEHQDKLDIIHGRISTYEVRRQGVEELKEEMKISDEDSQQLSQLKDEEYEIIQKIEGIQSVCKSHYLILADDAKKKISLKCDYQSIQIMKDGYEDKYRLNF